MSEVPPDSDPQGGPTNSKMNLKDWGEGIKKGCEEIMFCCKGTSFLFLIMRGKRLVGPISNIKLKDICVRFVSLSNDHVTTSMCGRPIYAYVLEKEEENIARLQK